MFPDWYVIEVMRDFSVVLIGWLGVYQFYFQIQIVVGGVYILFLCEVYC